MKTVSIRELHAHTGALVREAASGPMRITDRGRVVAILQPPSMTVPRGVPLPDREEWIATLPEQTIDSTDMIGEDRDR